jgi:site-specific recombinase XerD
VPNVKGETLPAGRHITAGEIKALFNVCINDNSPSGYRDAAILGLLAGCGLRRAEVVVLDLADYDELTGELKITGKRNKQRLAYLTNGAADALNDWLAIRGKGEGALFMAINKGGNIQPGRLTDQSVYDMLLRRAIQAGIEPLSPHDLRRTFIGELLDAGADIATVSFLAGHQNVNTTARYDRRPEQAKRKAAELLHVPYIKRLGLNK